MRGKHARGLGANPCRTSRRRSQARLRRRAGVEVVALGGVTRCLEGPRQVIGGLDALDHDGETQCSAEFSDRGDEGPLSRRSKSSNVPSIFSTSTVSLISMPSDE